MNLKGKFILAVTAILTLSYSGILLYTAHLQNRLILGQAEQQAKMLHRQIILTRQWIADHQGLFLLQSQVTPSNAFLEEPFLTTTSGQVLVKRNPAMVTRELSEYATQSGMGWFRVTSLHPVNPANSPDPFEHKSLKSFQQGAKEQLLIEQSGNNRVLRYAAPLVTESSCLGCHGEHGYTPGDIRGALSVTIPIGWAEAAISRNNRIILLLGVFSVLVVAIVMLLLFNRLVGAPISRLAEAMAAFPDTPPTPLESPRNSDEISRLTHTFTDLCQRLADSQRSLTAASEQGFRSEKLAALGHLTAGVAHEINNPLAGMLNCVNLMQQEPTNRELHQRYLPLLHKGLKRIESIMRQLLNYGRVAPLRIHEVEIDTVILDCLELLGHRLRNIVVNLDLRFNSLCCIDSEAIKQVVMNIALNATQAMPNGGCLDISSREEKGVVVLTFADTGMGMSSELLDRIFDPFFTTKEVGEGTGLGLAVTQSLVQRLGGRIEVTSIPGQGTTFVVELPVDRQCLQRNQNEEPKNADEKNPAR
jgi:signal transduction histidine kinase